ncbi:MAG: OB-fold nucleic acid binding domain-containing protein [Candidatus Hodarchaeota archaeon]
MRERMTAVRASVADIVNGTYREDEGPHVISPYGVELRRVALVGMIVDQYAGQGNFASITIDDGTETIRAKAWGSEASSLEQVKKNVLTLLVGKVREYEGEVYIVPEVIRELDDPNYMGIHLMERYAGMLTLSGVSTPASADLEDFIDETSVSEPTSSKERSPTKSTHVAGKIYKQILQYIELHATSDGISIEDIVSFFEERGHDRSDIQLKVIDLQEQEKIIEVSVGVYRPADI